MKIMEAIKASPLHEAKLPQTEQDKIVKRAKSRLLAWFPASKEAGVAREHIRYVTADEIEREDWTPVTNRIEDDNAEIENDNENTCVFDEVLLGRTKNGNVFIKDSSNFILPDQDLMEDMIYSVRITSSRSM